MGAILAFHQQLQDELVEFIRTQNDRCPSGISYCVIYSSAEPCPMCYSAICWANLQALVFAATRFDAAVEGVNFSDEEIYNELATPYPNRKLKVIPATTGNSLDAFNLWKRSEKTNY